MNDRNKIHTKRELRRLAAAGLDYDYVDQVSLRVHFSDFDLYTLAEETELICKEIIESKKYSEALCLIEQINCFYIGGCGFCKLRAQELLDKYGIDVGNKWGGRIVYDLMKLKRIYERKSQDFEINCTWEEFQEKADEAVGEQEVLEILERIFRSLFSLQLWYMEEKEMFPLDVIDSGMVSYNYEIKKFAKIDEWGEIVEIRETPQQELQEKSFNTPNLQEKTETNFRRNNSPRRKRGRPNRQNDSLKDCSIGVDANKLLAVLHELIDNKPAANGVRYIAACINGGLLESPTGGMVNNEFEHITPSNYNKCKGNVTDEEKEDKLKIIQNLLKRK